MNAVTSHCANCGASLESDSDFCTNCGAAKRRANQAPPMAKDPHSWMDDAPPAAPPANVAPVVPPSPQVQHVHYVLPPQSNTAQDNGLPQAVRTMGIIALSLMLVGLIPCLGWVNYLNFAFSFITFVLSIVALTSARSDNARNSALIGLVLVILANCIGMVRLVLGGGCL